MSIILGPSWSYVTSWLNDFSQICQQILGPFRKQPGKQQASRHWTPSRCRFLKAFTQTTEYGCPIPDTRSLSKVKMDCERIIAMRLLQGIHRVHPHVV